MPGKWITQSQVKIYMKAREEGYTQAISAAKSGISERTGRSIEQEQRVPPETKERHWRTRKDPLALVWEPVIEPMLKSTPDLQAITLLEYLQKTYPGEYDDSLLRTLQRRVKQWRLLHGPAQEVMFRQQHEPGHLGLSDFTQLKQTTITIAGCEFSHLLYHFRLIYSKWSYMKVIIGGESYPALAEGLQEALHSLGGSPLEHRTDSLSAAFKNLSQDAQRDITQSYDALCKHYQMKASRNNRGCGHENGGVESPHGHIKRRIEQALLLRGNNDFPSVEAYQQFIQEVVNQHNRRNAKAMTIERQLLQSLPIVKTMDYRLTQAVVTRSSTIDVCRVTYTVPSQLQGQTLQIRLYDDRLVCYLGSVHVITLNRTYPIHRTQRVRVVDYKHIIHSLVKKPQAFRCSQLRDDILPTADYKAIWQHVNETMEPKAACRFIVGLLHLAATVNCEQALAQTVLTRISGNKTLSLSQLQAQFKPESQSPPDVVIQQHPLDQYNQLIPQKQEENHG